MKDCITCKYNQEQPTCIPVCKQGHTRGITAGTTYIVIDNCHAYKEKEKCDCYTAEEYISIYKRDPMSLVFDITCKKCGRKL